MTCSTWFRTACLLLAVVGALAMVGPALADTSVVYEDATLTPSIPVWLGNFGASVAVSGDTAVVGTPDDDHAGGQSAGSVFVFVRSGTTWSEQAKLTASDAAAFDEFGESVSMSGDTIVVGNPADDQSAGSVYVFVRNGTTWSEQAKLTASNAAAFDYFGESVAVSGNTVVVGAIQADIAGGSYAGMAYVFVRNGTTWTEQAKLQGSDTEAFDYFGASVAVSGDIALFGAKGDGHAGGYLAGSAYVFVRDGTTWTEEAKLTASDAAARDRFGFSVALFGVTAVLGSREDDHSGVNDAGSAYVFVRSGTTWTEQAKLMASDATTADFLGQSVAVWEDTAVIGARLASHSGGGYNAGWAYVFARSGTAWTEEAKLMASDAEAYDWFGGSVAVSGDTVMVGAPGADHPGANGAGSVYVYQLNQPPVAICMEVTVPAGPACTAEASVDAGSFDPDGDPIALAQSPPGPYGLGNTLVTLTVTDDQGAADSCMATVTVEDTTAPELSVELIPDTLWPPNHRMVNIEASVIASDVCSTPSLVLTSITSNEADNGGGDGNTVNDIQGVEVGTPDFELLLRAERAGGGTGRIYTAVYSATDGSGNNVAAAGFAVVPHDQGGITEPIDLLLEENGNGTLASWTEAPGAVSYDVIRGQLGQIVETEVVIDLGTVVCIEDDSPDASTLGWEDAALPNPGEAFFYLVEYYDGTYSSYGTESADKQRAPGPGDCQ